MSGKPLSPRQQGSGRLPKKNRKYNPSVRDEERDTKRQRRKPSADE